MAVNLELLNIFAVMGENRLNGIVRADHTIVFLHYAIHAP